MQKSFLVPVLITAAVVSFSGCGSAVSTLSEEDQNKVAIYSAQVISKYNNSSDTGIVKLAEKSKEKTAEKTSTKKKKKKSAASTGNTSEASAATSSTITEAIGISGMQFLYRDAKRASGYSQGDVYDLTPDDGNELLVVRVKARNITKSPIRLDMPSQSVTFTASYGDETVNSDMTLLMNDLSTYQGTFRAGQSRNMIILFQFPKGTVKSVNKVQYSVGKGDSTVSVNIEKSKKG